MSHPLIRRRSGTGALYADNLGRVPRSSVRRLPRGKSPFPRAETKDRPWMQTDDVPEHVAFAEIAEAAPKLQPHFLIGSSKGYSIARRLKVPLIRVGFPIHDRIGGQRVLHLGYRGTQALFDRIINPLLEVKQEASPIGYSYL